jgi:probable HAF family extracellular repeat protein
VTRLDAASPSSERRVIDHPATMVAGGAQYRYDVIPIDVDGVIHAVNNSLQYAGQLVTADGSLRAIRIRDREITLLGTLGGSASSARSVNEAGAIVGGALTDGDASYHAFLYEHEAMRDLNELIPPEAGWELIHALAINDRGDIVAIGHREGEDGIVLLKPRKVASSGSL